jgi:hypothetical protein
MSARYGVNPPIPCDMPLVMMSDGTLDVFTCVHVIVCTKIYVYIYIYMYVYVCFESTDSENMIDLAVVDVVHGEDVISVLVAFVAGLGQI